MKKITLVLLMAFMGIHTFAQVEVREKRKTKNGRPARCPVIYISTSTGLNNSTGFVGFSFDVPVMKYVSLEAGAGISTWGSKLCLGAKYYFKPCQRGWAFGCGVTRNSGLQNYNTNLETIYGQTEPVTFNLNPQTNILFAAYHYWNMGRKYNRLYTELGWSIPVSGDKFVQTEGDPISDNSTKALNLISPGGIVAAFGISIGINRSAR